MLRSDKSFIKFLIILFIVFGSVLSLVYYASIIHKQKVNEQHTEQLEKINKICSNKGGVQSFEYGEGFICRNGSAFKLEPIN